MPHGPDGTKLGYVVMVMIRCCDSSFAHASDIQGPISSRPLAVLREWRPDIVFLSGPPTYFDGYKVDVESVEKGLENLKTLCSLAGDMVIADHHFARDIEYPRYLEALRASCKRILSAAEFMGVSYEPLEALRKELWRAGGEATDSDRAS
jgi:predicted metallo-beta-lactamase superfamily hydrolase